MKNSPTEKQFNSLSRDPGNLSFFSAKEIAEDAKNGSQGLRLESCRRKGARPFEW